MKELSERAQLKLAIGLTLYLTSLFASNTLGLKIMPFPLGLHVSVGVFMFPFVFLTTDVVGEIYGKRIARLFVLSGAVSTVLFILYSLVSLATPWAAAGEWAHVGYDQIFGISLRIAIASVVAFVVGEYQDIIAFFFLRDRLKNAFGTRLFWLRSNLSNLWSQLLDTVLFMGIAFYGIYDTRTLLTLILSWWLFKVLMGVLYTPLSYIGLRLLRAD